LSGRRAALKVAAKNALRNRKRTIFLVLIVAIAVALGVVVAGIVRASNFTPEEAAQLEFGTADVVINVSGGDEVLQWVYDNAAAIDPDLSFTTFRRTGVTLEDFQFAVASDLDLDDPLSEGMLILLDGMTPASPGEAAVSPRVAENMDLEVGDRVEFEDLHVGTVEIVGVVAEPIASSDSTILLWPGALEEVEPTTSMLMGGANAETAASRLEELWWSEGQQSFWPEPAVDPVPQELQFLEQEVYLFLTKAEIEDLVKLAQANPENLELVSNSAWEIVYGSGRPFTLANVYMETRTQRLGQGSFESNPTLLSMGASTLLLIEVAFITGAAFAAGTRRRLREIGLLGASGASEKHIRTTVIGEGLTIGLVGAALGVLLGFGVLVLGRPLLQRFVTRLITGVGVSISDIVGPVAVALVAVLLAVLIPARTASRIPTTTALQGRMPASSPRRWVIPAGLIASALGGILITVSLASTSNFSGALVAVGGVMVVGGVAMLASPILAGVSRLADHVPATSRLVLRDSGRHRTRSAVAVAAIMVILLAPAILVTMAETSEHQDLLYGMPEPSNQLLLSGSYDQAAFEPLPITEDDIAAVAEIVPERQIATFEVVDVRVRTQEQLEIEAAATGAESTIQLGPSENRIAVASPALVDALDDDRVAAAIVEDRIVVLGVENKETTVSLDFEELPAVELAIPVIRWAMPRVLVPGSVAAGYTDAESRSMALFILDRPLNDREQTELSATLSLEVTGGRGYLSDAAIYGIGAAVTLLAVLIVISLVTAVSAAEVDEELQTIVAVGAPGSFRRRFLGLLTGYQTLIGAALAVPLGLGLMKVFTSARESFYQGPFGELSNSAIFIPWAPLLALLLVTPLVVGLLTLVSVRSAPVTPPRRAT
jgi:putative ABC transport system permease protein